MKLSSVKIQLAIFLGLFALYLAIADKDILFLLNIVRSVFFCLAAESLFIYLKDKKLKITDSSVISGQIIGFVISSDSPWWAVLLASFFAIGSKYLVRISQKHIFNPAAFGIFCATTIFGAQTQWKGTYLWYILIPAGLYFVYKIRKREIILGYFLASLLLFGIQAVMQKTPLFNIFGYFSYFYIFVMVIEPKTTPVTGKGKFMFGTCIAAMIFILTEIGVRFDAELLTLVALNSAVPLLNRLTQKKGA